MPSDGVINDLHQIKELMKTTPIESINMGIYSYEKARFIRKYGIDNIIKLDESSNGMFSHELLGKDTYLAFFASEEFYENGYEELNENKKYTYEEFKDRMYDILLNATKKMHLASLGINYDFISGEFRNEHADMFLSEDVDPSIKRKFYLRLITAEYIRKNSEVKQLLKGKDLSIAFKERMTIIDSNGDKRLENMAKYIGDKFGQEEFFNLCTDYGGYLEIIKLNVTADASISKIRENIEDKIYQKIKTEGEVYSEDLPKSFKEKHPDLFLPKEIDENYRYRFYSGQFNFENIRWDSQLKEILLSKDLDVGFRETKRLLVRSNNGDTILDKLSKEEILDFAAKYGNYLSKVNPEIFVEGQSKEEKEIVLQKNIEQNILNRISPFRENWPEFFKERHPEFVLADDAPVDLKLIFYRKMKYVDFFLLIKENPEWKNFLKGKNIRLSLEKKYDKLYNILDNESIMKLGFRDPKTLAQMVTNGKETTLVNWYKATGGKFVPNYIVMLEFPEDEIDNFLANSKKWNKLMRIEQYNDDVIKSSMLKAAYSMGVFHGDDKGFSQILEMFTGIPKSLTLSEYDKINSVLSVNPNEKQQKQLETFRQAYQKHDDGKYYLNFNEQKDKKRTEEIRKILEQDIIEAAGFKRIITPEKAHKIFDSFKMEYNPNFAKFFYENLDKILESQEYTTDISKIQRQFKEIERVNSGRRITLDIAQDYIKSVIYTDIDVGNEEVAKQSMIAGYSQEDFEKIQELYNEGETREFSSIPRIKGEINGYTYEMLRCDDPLALTIGTLTDCCQAIYGAGETSMEHSVVSPDGRVFCVRDEEGRIVAQSWVWRNKYTICFDNIEIPNRLFELLVKKSHFEGRKEFTV